MNAPTTVPALRQQQSQLAHVPDQAVDMFTERGFVLANRIAKAFAASDAVPAQFRTHTLKKVGRDEHWVENPSAIGNCLVAIEVARAVGMSITAVMQNADMIEGKLRWSGKFVIAAINASGRFTPLRFQSINRGRISATYKEKTGWDEQARRPVFTDRNVEVDDIECIAWALPRGIAEPQVSADMLRQYPNRLLDLYKSLGMPVIESAPVTMQMAVEEGWYGKPGSKWQTGMRALMFQYRAGSFFGNIHAPDIVMGMGPTTEEARDMVTLDLGPDGQVTSVTTETLRQAPAPAAEVVEQPGASKPASVPQAAQVDQAQPAQTNQQQATPTFDLDAFAEKLDKCTTADTLEVMADEVSGLQREGQISDDAAATLFDIYRRRKGELQGGAGQQRAAAPAAAPATRTRSRAASASNPQQSLD